MVNPNLAKPSNLGETAKNAAEVAGKVAVATALAATLSAGPVDETAFELPQATPIVYVMQPPTPDQPPATPDEEPDQKTSAWQTILKIIKWALIVLLLAGTCIFGAVKGCTALGLAPILPAPAETSDNNQQN